MSQAFHILLCTLTIMLLSIGSFASPPLPALTIDEALQQAVTSNPALKATMGAAEEASWKPLESIAAQLPRVTASLNHFVAKKYQVNNISLGTTPAAIPLIFPSSVASFDLNWTIFDSFQTWNNYKASREISEAASLEAARAKLKLEGEVRLKFYQALAAQLLLEVAEQNVKTLEEHSTRIQGLLKQGRATKFDALRSEVQLREALPDRLAAQDNVILARQALYQSVGKEEDQRQLEGTLPEPDESLLTRLPETADITSRDDIQASIKRANASEKQHLATIGVYLPRLSLTGQKLFYNNLNDSLTDTGSYRDAYSVGFLLTWPLFDGGAAYSKRQQIAAQQKQAEANAAAAVLRAPYELNFWRRRYSYNTSLFQARRKAIEAAEESVRLAKLGQLAGTRTNTDVIDSQLDLFRARAGLVRAKVDAAEASINLELATGRKFL